MAMKLHKVTGRAKKCGPSAISAITGDPTHNCAWLLRELTGKRAINGLWESELIKALHFLNLKTRFIPVTDDNKTINRFSDWAGSGTQYDDRAWIVLANNHYIVFTKHEVVDNGYMFTKKPQRYKLTDVKFTKHQVKTIIEVVPC